MPRCPSLKTDAEGIHQCLLEEGHELPPGDEEEILHLYSLGKSGVGAARTLEQWATKLSPRERAAVIAAIEGAGLPARRW